MMKDFSSTVFCFVFWREVGWVREAGSDGGAAASLSFISHPHASQLTVQAVPVPVVLGQVDLLHRPEGRDGLLVHGEDVGVPEF
jgi:hypothetical protein